jgi:predicted DNA-binding protein
VAEPLKSTHVRLSSEAHRVLSALADLEDKDNAELARLILEEALLGRVHTLTLAANRYKRLGFTGISGELGGNRREAE